uniref:Uncharacterized protein n=1 Tax=Panagrolaimus superbus TaxID=310955 RepID=A0A914YEE5_9BILA
MGNEILYHYIHEADEIVVDQWLLIHDLIDVVVAVVAGVVVVVVHGVFAGVVDDVQLVAVEMIDELRNNLKNILFCLCFM